jgi:hypothetical protein
VVPVEKIGKLFMLKLFIFLIGTLSFCNSAFAASIKTNVSQNQVGVGDVFSVAVEVTFNDSAQPELSIYEIPQHPKISFLRQSDSYSYQSVITNGKAVTTKTVTLNMIFYAKEMGRVQVPNIKMKINNKVFAAKGFQIEVVKKGSPTLNKNQNRRRSNDPFSGMESLFKEFFKDDNPFVRKNQRAGGGDLDFFIDVEVSNMNPYAYEQFVGNWYLYTNGRVTDIDTLKYPALEGFWKDEISLATSLSAEEVQKNGRVFTRYLLASYALTPIVNDQAFIDPYEVKCQLIGGFFSLGSKELVRKSDEALVKIKPLPLNKPLNFTGAVGDFKISSYVSDQVFKIGQPFEFVIKVKGQGQLKFMELPDLKNNLKLDSEVFSIYDSSEESVFNPPSMSTKTYKILVVPQKVGPAVIPEMKLAFFDPKISKFYQMKTKPIEIQIQKGDSQEQDIVSAFIKKNKNEFKLKPFSAYTKSQSGFGIPSYYYVLIFLILSSMGFAFLTIFYLKNHIAYDFQTDLSSRFLKLENLIQKDQWREASTLAVNIVYFYANSKTKKKPKSQRLDDILDVFPTALRRSIEESVTNLNQDLQKYSFAPQDLITESNIKEKVLEKILALKALLERSS